MFIRQLILALSLLLASVAVAQPVGTSFSYQGTLQIIEPSGRAEPANGEFDFNFTLFDAAAGGAVVGTPFMIGNVLVADGVFTVAMDFGIEPYSGDQLWLQIEVRNGPDTGVFAALAPRQAVTPTPFATLTEFVAPGSVGEAEVIPDQVQLRVSDNCPEGTLVSGIEEDGSISCETDDDEQTIALNDSVLSISDGNSVDLADSLVDQDDSNELNTGINFDGDILTLSDAGGDQTADLSSLSEGAQTLSVDPSSISISDGNSVDLAPILNDSDADNELNTGVDFDGTSLTVSDAGGDLSADLSALINADDNELNTGVSFDGTDLSVTDAGGSQSADISALVNNDTNELNTGVSFDGSSINVTDAGGSQSADLSALVNDDSNELNTGVTFDGSNLSVTDADGTLAADLSALTNDDTNELNTGISYSGNTLTLSDAGGDQSVTLTGAANNDSNELNTGFALSGTILSITDADGSLSADLAGLLDNTDAQTLGISGTSLTISGGNALDLAALLGDGDPTNELNTSLSFDGTNLNITDAGGTLSADLSGLNDSAIDLLNRLITLDGADSGLDADLLDGMQASDIIAAAGPGDNRIPISELPFDIDEPGSYYVTRDLVNTTDDTNGITIDADNVTLDLGGFRLTADMGPNTGVGVFNRNAISMINQVNVHIRNGRIADWDASGIAASSCEKCIFENLTISGTSVGLRTGSYSLVNRVTTSFNRTAGMSVDEGTLIAHSTAQGNEGSGFINSGSSVVINCAALENENHGFSMSAVILGSTAYKNGLSGYRAGTGSILQQNSSIENGENGFLIISGYARDNIAFGNGTLATADNLNNGFFLNGNSYLINNYAHANRGAGIQSANSDNVVENNVVLDNLRSGIDGRNSGSLIIGNRASGNGPNSSTVVNYTISTGTAAGPIININGVGDISAVSGGDHPLVNYEY